jgi:hypothetical protein
MSIYQNSTTFKNAIDLTPVNFALANLGDQIIIEHDISIKAFTISNSSTEVIVNNKDGYFIDGVCSGLDFSIFKVGDSVSVRNYTDPPTYTDYGTYTVVQIIDNSTIVFNADIGGFADNDVTGHIVFSLVNPVTALSYKWNFIENQEATNYYSKVDGSVQMATISGLNPAGAGTDLPMTFIGQLPYQIGSIVVDEVSLVSAPVFTSNFKIRHTTRITPIMLAEQWDDIQADIKPSYFFNLACLKSIFFFEARYNLSDPNNIQSLESDTTLGNTGWFNENFNTSLTNYYRENLTYTNSATSTIVPKAQLSLDEIEFSFDIRNTVDTPFVAGSTKLVLNFCKAPNDESEYQANGRDMVHNFVWESALLTVQSTPTGINGDNYSDLSLKSLADLKATFISSSKITITGKLAFDQLGIDVFNESNEPRYMFWVSTQDHTKVGTVADRTNLLLDSAPFFFQSEFPGLITFASKLIPHDVENYSDSFFSKEKFSEDELVGYSYATIIPDPLVTSLNMTRVTNKVIAYEILTGKEFTLESKTTLLPNDVLVSGYQFFDIPSVQNIRIPSTEIRKNIVVKRDSGLNYIFAYPFLNRWEYWVKLMGVDSYFFNASKPNNGFNQNWAYYFDRAWVFKYKTEIGCKVNGIPAIYSDTVDFDDWDRNLTWDDATTTATIKTYDGATELTDGSKKYILGYKNTLVKAEFTLGTNFDVPSTVVVIGIEVFEEGGVTGKRRMSSKYVSDSDTWFIPLSGQTKTKLTFDIINPKICTAETEIDFTKIQTLLGKAKWKLTARLYSLDTYGDLGQIVWWNNYLASQDVYMIANNPIDEETIVLPPNQLDCCDELVWNVLADTASNDALKNDVNRFLWWFNKDVIDTAVMSLEKSDGSIVSLNDNTYGLFYDYGFNVNGFNENMIGYEIEWKKVLTLLGEGSYRVQCYNTTIFGATNTQYSENYCLSQYNDSRANGTVRIEYFINGLLGNNKNDEKQRDFGQLNWYNQHRFDGMFCFKSAPLKEEDVVYTSGQRQPIELEQEPEYTLELKPIPAFKHNVLRTDILMADNKLITDYNFSNFDNYYKKKVIVKSGYDPKIYPKKSKLASVVLTFIQEFNKLKKFRS